MRLYLRLAVTNLKNNRRTYVPYMLTAILSIMMFFMIDTLGRIKEKERGRSSSSMQPELWGFSPLSFYFIQTAF